MPNHLASIRKLRTRSRGAGETEAGSVSSSDAESDLDVDLDAVDVEDPDVDSDEDEDANEKSDPKSDTTLLLPSLFKHLPPTVFLDYAKFSGARREAGKERCVEYSEAERTRNPFQFRSNNTIVCFGGAMKRSGFTRLERGKGYNVFWGHHLREEQLQKLHSAQRVNHFPGSYTLGRKDYLHKNMSRQARAHPSEYDFMAKTWTLPRDRDSLMKAFEDGHVYIIKPPASAEGRGIRLANKPEQLPRPNFPAVVQEYIANPHLINGKKYDLRIYVAVTSFDPLRCYMYEEGLVRFATVPYNATFTSKSIKDRFMHLTNYSVNKTSADFVVNESAARDDEGSKWSLTALWKYLSALNKDTQIVDVAALKRRIRDIAVKTLIAGEQTIVSKWNQAGRPSCFELFGLDVLLDSTFKPWLLEVNVACSLASSSPLDKHIKHFMMTDLMHLAGITPMDRRKAAQDEDREARKPAVKKRSIFELRALPLSRLDKEDLEIIATAEDELTRAGGWRRLFPCEGNGNKAYLPLFAFARYRNTVLAKWAEHKDWSLMGPLVSPSLPSDHELRKLVEAASREKAERSPAVAARAAWKLAEAASKLRLESSSRARLALRFPDCAGLPVCEDGEPAGDGVGSQGGGGENATADGQNKSAAELGAAPTPRAAPVSAMPRLYGCTTGASVATHARIYTQPRAAPSVVDVNPYANAVAMMSTDSHLFESEMAAATAAAASTINEEAFYRVRPTTSAVTAEGGVVPSAPKYYCYNFETEDAAVAGHVAGLCSGDSSGASGCCSGHGGGSGGTHSSCEIHHLTMGLSAPSTRYLHPSCSGARCGRQHTVSVAGMYAGVGASVGAALQGAQPFRRGRGSATPASVNVAAHVESQPHQEVASVPFHAAVEGMEAPPYAPPQQSLPRLGSPRIVNLQVGATGGEENSSSSGAQQQQQPQSSAGRQPQSPSFASKLHAIIKRTQSSGGEARERDIAKLLETTTPTSKMAEIDAAASEVLSSTLSSASPRSNVARVLAANASAAAYVLMTSTTNASSTPYQHHYHSANGGSKGGDRMATTAPTANHRMASTMPVVPITASPRGRSSSHTSRPWQGNTVGAE